MSQLTLKILEERANVPTRFELNALKIKKLNTCPFCKSDQIYLCEDRPDNPGDNFVEIWCRCDSCGGDGPPGITRLFAINRWHFRDEATVNERNN